MTGGDNGPAGIDPTRPSVARRYNKLLGGKDNFEVDRESVANLAKVFPSVEVAARTNRAFLVRSVTYLAGQAGVRQFLDIGTGLPASENTHDIAQRIDPTCRVVYVDHDPLVLTHARALLTGTPEGATDYIDADMRHPATILEQARATLDFTQPIAVTMLAVLHFLDTTDNDRQAIQIVQDLTAAMPAGSYLALSVAARDLLDDERTADEITRIVAVDDVPFAWRTRQQTLSLLHGVDLVDPGLVPIGHWRPAPGKPPVDGKTAPLWAAVGKIQTGATPEIRQ